MRESNPRQRFWRPLSYHLTNPLYALVALDIYTTHIGVLSMYISCFIIFYFIFLYFYIFLNTESNTFPSARTKTAAAIASGIPDAVIVPIISPHTAVIPTSHFYIFLNTESNTFPSARTKTAAAIASGIPDAVIVPIISPHTAVIPTSLACAYSFANRT